MSEATAEKHVFQAEIQQLLDLVVHSLYTDREIFLRELISNASDAMEKLRHIEAAEKDVHDAGLPLQVEITADKEAGTLTIQDHGIGMTRDELVENLGTIAHSDFMIAWLHAPGPFFSLGSSTATFGAPGLVVAHGLM